MRNTNPAGDLPVLRLRSPHDVIAAVPYLLGFHPDDSLVAIASGGPQGTCAIRLDLPLDEHVDDAVEHLAALLAHNGFRQVVLVGYGPEQRVTPLVTAAGAGLGGKGVEVLESLRVEGGRFWSCQCTVPECCPPEGTPYDITTSPIAVQATVEGRVALTGRDEVARSVAPVGGLARESMRRATGRAQQRFFRWAREAAATARSLDDATEPLPSDARTPEPQRAHVRAPALLPSDVREPEPATPEELLHDRMVGEGLPFVRGLLDRAEPLTDDEVAWLGVLLTHLRVRDEAWVHTDQGRLDLWRYVLCRVEAAYVPAPACLTAYAAYLAGDGALANIALDRAFAVDPDYSMAGLLRDMMRAGVPPWKARLRMTPEALADAWDARPPDRKAGAR
ncbi:MAG TPA: DUF4192 domain-containing protein [Streptosporangiaceae bacterium]|jgi:hypothetical protein